MANLILILGDQLSHEISSLHGISKNDHIFMCEVGEEAEYAPHHKKKIAYIFSAMRHFAKELLEMGYKVIYKTLDDKDNKGSFDLEIKEQIDKLKPSKLIITESGEYRVNQKFEAWKKQFNLEIEVRPDTRFLANHHDFKKYAQGKKVLRMEFFYREMRKKYGILLDSKGNPEGGKWNYDAENRKFPKGKLTFPKRVIHSHDSITKEVLDLVSKKFSKSFGSLEHFNLAVTRNGAMEDLNHFIDKILPYFGEYQDAMITDEAYLYHSNISTYINSGLLYPLEAIKLAEKAYYDGKAPLNAVEGFIRQILGWREYIRGIYWLFMPKYKELNFFEAKRKLPWFYWDHNKTDMNCMKQAIKQTYEHAYSHHIQRLMVTGNFALIAGIDPKEVCDWYLGVYSDAYEWVELPNTLGMALFGDGGIVGSKPYAASGNYINKMSNFCKGCKYDPTTNDQPNSCPFNYLYWDFMIRNENKLRPNPRLAYSYNTLGKMADSKKEKFKLLSSNFLDSFK